MPQDLYKLHEGWEWSNLNSACSLITDGAHASPKTSDVGNPYITVRDINGAGNIDLQGCKKISDADFQKLIDGNCSPQEGAILFSKDGTVGKVALVQGYEPFVVLSSLAILQPKPKLIRSDYLKYFMLSPLLQETAIGSKTGAAIKRIVLRTIKTLQIPLPPLGEQERIVEKLDALFRRIDDATARLNQILTHSKALFASALDSVFSTGTWPNVNLPDLVQKDRYAIKRGPFGSALKKAFFVPEGYRVYEQKHAIQNRFDIGNYYISSEKFDELKVFSVQPGDLIMSCSGTVGRIAEIPEGAEEGIINQALLKISLDRDVVNCEFFKYFMNRYVSSGSLDAQVKGAAIKNVASVKELKTIQIPLPPMEEQQRIVEHLDGLSSRIQHLGKMTRARLDHLVALKASLLDAAFRGQL